MDWQRIQCHARAGSRVESCVERVLGLPGSGCAGNFEEKVGDPLTRDERHERS